MMREAKRPRTCRKAKLPLGDAFPGKLFGDAASLGCDMQGFYGNSAGVIQKSLGEFYLGYRMMPGRRIARGDRENILLHKRCMAGLVGLIFAWTLLGLQWITLIIHKVGNLQHPWVRGSSNEP